jgi:iron complex transport system substrate-binding protein
MTLRSLRLPLAATAFALVAAACGSDGDEAGATDTTDAPAETVAFEHSQGSTDVPTDPQRIVTTTDQNALLPLLELGVTPVASAGLIGDDGAQSFRRTEGFDTDGIEFVGAYGEPNAEAIAAQRPDLIVGYEFDSDHYDTLTSIAPTVLVQIFDRPREEELMDFARLVGRTEQAEELRAEYEARIEALLEGLGDRRDRLSISVITAGDPGQFYRADTGQAVGTVTDRLDLLRPTPQQGAASFDDTFSVEQIAEHDADVVLVIDFSGEDRDPGFSALVDSPLYANLAASQAGQAHVIDGTATVGAAWARMGRFLDELERILLDPDLDVDVVDEAAG